MSDGRSFLESPCSRRTALQTLGASGFAPVLTAVGTEPATATVSPPSVAWSRTYGDGTSVFAVERTSDGGYVVGGSVSRGDEDAPSFPWLAKFTGDGEPVWKRTYDDDAVIDADPDVTDPPTFQGSEVAAIAPAEMGYVVAFSTSFFGPHLMNVGPEGEVRWTETLPRASDLEAHFLSAALPVEGGGTVIGGGLTNFLDVQYPIAGEVNEAGEFQWLRYYDDYAELNPGGLAISAWFSDLVRAPDGGYVGAGGAYRGYSQADLRPWMAKISSDGKLVWSRQYRDLDLPVQRGGSLAPVRDGGYVVSLDSFYVFGLDPLRSLPEEESFLLYVDEQGTPGRTEALEGYAHTVIQSADSQYARGHLVIGWTSDPEDGWALRVGEEGEPIWEQQYDFRADGQLDALYDAVEAHDGCYVLGGWTGTTPECPEAWVLKLSGSS